MAKSVSIRFYEELNEYLEPARFKREFEISIEEVAAVKDLIESLGVPPEKVDLILANGHSVSFDYVPQDGDRISVYPEFETFNIAKVTALQERPLRNLKFILDADLGELADGLRRFGLDVLHSDDYETQEIIHLSAAEKRTILTRHPKRFSSQAVTRCYLVKQTDPEQQFYEVIRHFDLK